MASRPYDFFSSNITGCVVSSQDGATPAVLASKAGHRNIADLIAAGGTPAARHQMPAQPPRGAKDDYTLYTSEQLRVHHLHTCVNDTV